MQPISESSRLHSAALRDILNYLNETTEGFITGIRQMSDDKKKL